MEIIDNVHKTLHDDLRVTLRSGSKVAIAASSFSIYAFQELKEQLGDIFRQAQTAFNRWAKFPAEERTTKNLLDMLNFDFIQKKM